MNNKVLLYGWLEIRNYIMSFFIAWYSISERNDLFMLQIMIFFNFNKFSMSNPTPPFLKQKTPQI